MSIAHGTIVGGLSVVPDLDAAVAAYAGTLCLELVISPFTWRAAGSPRCRFR